MKVKKEDLDKFRPVNNVEWKVLEVVYVPEEAIPSKKGNSLNYFVDVKIVAPDNDDKGLTFGHCCNTKGTFAVAPFVAACHGKTVPELFGDETEIDLDLGSTQNKLCEALVGHRVNEDSQQTVNDIREFAPLGTHFPSFDPNASSGDEPGF